MFNQATERAFSPASSLVEGVVIMSTYGIDGYSDDSQFDCFNFELYT